MIAAIDDFFSTNYAPDYTVTLAETVFDGIDPENDWTSTAHDSYAK